MKFECDPKYIKERIRSNYIGSIMMFLLVVALFVPQAYHQYKTGKEELIWIGFILFSGLVAITIKNHIGMGKWVKNAKATSLEISHDKLITRNSIGISEMNTDAIERLIVQMRRDKVIGLLIKSKNGSLEKLVGFLNMDGLVEELSAVLPKDKVKAAKWFHR
ncbi:MAG: hypothetical protein ABSG48_00360 [Geobacteraceae bacterium]